MDRERADQLPLAAQWGALLAAAALFIVGLRIVLGYIPFASDWEVYFRPATQGWLESDGLLFGWSNWTFGFWNPPWLLWLLLPLMVWPVWFGWAVIIVLTLLTMVWLTRGYERRWLVFISPLIVDFMVNGQVEIVPMLGIALGWLAGDHPHLLGIALVLMAAKPQAGFLVALWLWLHHKHHLQALLIPLGVLGASLVIHGWDWPLYWMAGPSVLILMRNLNNSSPWRSVGFWMAPVALGLGLWALRLRRSKGNLGAVVTANALIVPYLSSHSLIQVLTFGLLPLGPGWALAGWLASNTVLLRGVFGKAAMPLDFLIAAVLMIGYLLHADRQGSVPSAPTAGRATPEAGP